MDNQVQIDSEKTIVNCPLCGKDDYIQVRSGNIVKCNNCEMVYLRERPSIELLEQYYGDEYTTDGAAAWTVKTPQSKLDILTKEEYKGANRNKLLTDAINIWGKEIKDSLLVDIGCGWGGLLNNAKNKGFDVLGFELTKKNADFANNELQIKVHNKQFEEVPLEKNSIDIVTMSHVLEHVPQPSDVVNKIYSELNDGGIFYCIVPNFDSFCSKVLQEEWLWLERDWHYSHFTVETITSLFKKVGFEIVKIETKAGDYGDKIPKDILRRRFPDKSEKSIAELYSEMELNNLGEEIRIVGRKTINNLSTTKSENKNLIWIRTDSIGDQILSSSMLQPISEHYKDYDITVVCQQHIAQIYSKCPYVKDVISFNRAKILSDNNYLSEIINKIRSANAEITINSIYSRDAVSDKLALESGSKEIIGCEGDQANLPENLWQLHNERYTTIIKSDESLVSEIDRNNHFIKELGIQNFRISPNLWLDETDEKFAEELFSQNNLNENHVIVLFAGAQHEVRLYNHYGKAINKVLKGKDYSVILLGSNGDLEINKLNAMNIDLPILDLTGKTTINQSAAIVKKSKLVVGAETGLAHIACAVNTPNVILLGGGHFCRFMPYSDLTSVVSLPLDCFNCNWQCKFYQPICVQEVNYENIALAIEERLNGTNDKLKFYFQSDYIGKWMKESPEVFIDQQFLNNQNVYISTQQPKINSNSELKAEFGKLVFPAELKSLSNLAEKIFLAFSSKTAKLNNLQLLERKLIGVDEKKILQFENILLEVKENSFFNYLLALINVSKKRLNEALFYFKKSLDQKKTIISLVNIIQIYEKQYNIDSALKYFIELVDMGIENRELLLNAKKLLSVKKINESHVKSTYKDENFNINANLVVTEKSEKIKVSIVLPTKDRNDGLKEFLDSLQFSLLNINYEIILLVGGKTTNSYKSIIEKYGIQKVFSDADIFKENEKFSWAKLMNFGFRKADGDWIMYASDDIVMHPLAFNFAMQYDNDPQIGGISFLHRNTIQDYQGFFKEYGYDTVNDIPFINFGIVRKTAYKLVSGFDENFTFYNGDLDLCWRIVKAGFQIVPSKYSLVEHNNISDKIKSSNSGKVFIDDTLKFRVKWIDFIIEKNLNLIKDRKIVSDKNHFLRYVSEKSKEFNIPESYLQKITKDYQFIDNQQIKVAENQKIEVSAIVSVYNSEEFIQGCLDDLVNQTLFSMGRLEIVLINSGSEQNEDQIISEYVKTYPNITYIKTEEREPIYTAWNRGIKAASGEFITNANTDDRHKNDALEQMLNFFKSYPEIDLIYANCFQTVVPNDTFYSRTEKSKMEWIDYDKELLLFGCYMGPQPMWKKSLHEKYGYFDESLKVVGDYEFWLRIARYNAKIFHLRDTLGLYLYSETSAEHRDNSLTDSENNSVQKKYMELFITDYDSLQRLNNKFNKVAKTFSNKEYYEKGLRLIEQRQAGLNLEKEVYKLFETVAIAPENELLQIVSKLSSSVNSDEVIVDSKHLQGILHTMKGVVLLRLEQSVEAEEMFKLACTYEPSMRNLINEKFNIQV